MKRVVLQALLISLAITVQAQNVGIGNTSPRARLHVSDSSVLFTAGNPFSATAGNTPVSGPGGRMLWYAGKTAFRAGYVDGPNWNKDSIGYFSIGAGYNNRATGMYSAAFNFNTRAFGLAATAVGYNTEAGGQGSFASGSYSIATGLESAVFGSNNEAGGWTAVATGFLNRSYGDMSFTMGTSNRAFSPNSLVIGKYNDTTATTSLFEIGVGTAEDIRANAMTVLDNGSVGFGTMTPHHSAVVDMSSSTRGWLPPRMNTAQRNAIVDPAHGLVIFNTDYNCTDIFDGYNWSRDCGNRFAGYEDLPANNWSEMAAFPGSVRIMGVACALGNKGYFGTGTYDFTFYNDWWEYDVAANAWSQKASLPSSPRRSASCFAVNGKAYLGLGLAPGAGYPTDWWEYTPATNTWTQKANFTGGGRFAATGFATTTKGYVCAGFNGSTSITELWEFDPVANSWASRAPFTGLGRNSPTSFVIGDKAYVGLGLGNSSQFFNDFFEYNTTTNAWTAKASLPANGRRFAAGVTIGSLGYVGFGEANANYYGDWWEYNNTLNTWTAKAQPPGGRTSAYGFVVGSQAYIGGGYDNSFWRYNTQPVQAPFYYSNGMPMGNIVSDGNWKRMGSDVYSGNAGNLYISKNVGIGTTSVNQLLEVVSTASSAPATLVLGNRGGFGPAALEFVSDYGTGGQWRPGYIRSRDLGSYTGALEFYTNGTGNGNLYGNVKGFEVRNGQALTATGAVGSYSDARIKKDVHPFTDGLNVIRRINPVQFYYTNQAPFPSAQLQTGVVAQELEAIAPYMVQRHDEGGMAGLRSINNQAYTFLLINAVKEQQQQIDTLQQQVRELKQLVQSLIK